MGLRLEPGAPTELSPSEWQFPQVPDDEANELIGLGADLRPETILAAYRNGLFPMPFDTRQAGLQVGWWSPNPRGVLPPNDLRISRSLRRSLRRYKVTINQDFAAVIDGCRLTPRDGGWITRQLRDAYVELFRLGWAHSIETWTPSGELVGGLYGVGTHGLFAGESMFSLATDASKVALVKLAELLQPVDGVVLDVQWVTEHLATLGAKEVPRQAYRTMLAGALEQPSDSMFNRFWGDA